MRQNSDNSPIPKWINDGQNQNATYLIVIYDAQNESHNPVYVKADENLKQKRREYETGSYAVVTEYKL